MMHAFNPSAFWRQKGRQVPEFKVSFVNTVSSRSGLCRETLTQQFFSSKLMGFRCICFVLKILSGSNFEICFTFFYVHASATFLNSGHLESTLDCDI